MLPQPSIKNLECIVCRCTKARNLSLALSTYVHLQNTGLQTHVTLSNFLLSMLADVGSMCNALKIFHTLPTDDKSRWDHLINGYLKHGEERLALLVYQKMQEDCALLPSSHTLVALLKACAKLKDVKRGQLIHDQIFGLMDTDVYIGGALVDMYAKCGYLTKAQEVFDALPIVNVVVWNELIGGYVCNNKCKEALDMFEEMQAKGLSPNPVTYVLILKACSRIGAEEKGASIHQVIASEGLLSNLHVCSALVNMYVECGLIQKAQDLFQTFSQKNVVIWNVLIAAYAKLEHGEEALHLFHQMQHEGVPPNGVTFASMLMACGSIGSMDKANELHAEIERRGLHKTNVFVASGLVDMYAKCAALAKARELFDLLQERNVVTWNALIAGYAHEEHNEEALYCFAQMKLEGISPNPVTYTCALKACGAAGVAEKGIEIHEELTRKGLLRKNHFVGSALVDMYAKCGLLAKAQDVFDMLPVRNIVTWSALISGYAQSGRAENALFMFGKMISEGNEPDRVAFVSVLNACSHAGLVETAQTYFEAMSEDYGIPPCFSHQICMVDLFGRAGQLQSAAQIMGKTPFHPDLVSFVSLMGACRKWGDVEQGRRAFRQAVCLNEKVGGAYVCMYNIYADSDIVENETVVVQEKSGFGTVN